MYNSAAPAAPQNLTPSLGTADARGPGSEELTDHDLLFVSCGYRVLEGEGVQGAPMSILARSACFPSKCE